MEIIDIKTRIIELEQEKENYEYLAEGLISDHQSYLRAELLLAADRIEEQLVYLTQKLNEII